MTISFSTQEKFVTGIINLYNYRSIDCMTYSGISSGNEYVMSDDGGAFLLPCNDRDVLGIDWSECSNLRIVLPNDMSRYGLSYTDTFKHASILTNGNDEFYFGDEHISTNGMFDGAIFENFNYGLTIRDSKLDVNFMFHRSVGLQHVTFENCELTGLGNLFRDSDVLHVTFENCSNDDAVGDYDGLANNVFSWDMTKLTLKNCEHDFVAIVLAMFRDVCNFRNLEINIID